jgi:NhaP-type Na+/H+ or K+/H+ antiporter
MQAATGGLSGLTAVVLMLGFAIARLTTSTRYSAEVVLTSVAIAGGLVGGFVLMPFINGLVSSEASSEDREYQREDSS